MVAVRDKSVQDTYAPATRFQRSLIIISQVGALLFTLTYIIEGATRPNYSAFQQAISALSLGPGGWVQQVNFIAFGLFNVFVNVPVWRIILKPGFGAILVPVVTALSGLSMIVCGIFSQDPAPGYPYPAGTTLTVSTAGVIHVYASIVSIVSLLVITLLLAWRFFREPRWRIWTLYALISAVLIMFFMACFGASQARGADGLFVGPAGLFERLAVLSYSLLVLPVTIRAYLGTGRVATQP